MTRLVMDNDGLVNICNSCKSRATHVVQDTMEPPIASFYCDDHVPSWKGVNQ